LGSSARALAWSDELRRQGILVTAIRPPTVAENTARLRVTFSAVHTAAQVESLLVVLADVADGENR
jgi:8-amino-7-oxononanoate synthase